MWQVLENILLWSFLRLTLLFRAHSEVFSLQIYLNKSLISCSSFWKWDAVVFHSHSGEHHSGSFNCSVGLRSQINHWLSATLKKNSLWYSSISTKRGFVSKKYLKAALAKGMLEKSSLGIKPREETHCIPSPPPGCLDVVVGQNYRIRRSLG